MHGVRVFSQGDWLGADTVRTLYWPPLLPPGACWGPREHGLLEWCPAERAWAGGVGKGLGPPDVWGSVAPGPGVGSAWRAGSPAGHRTQADKWREVGKWSECLTRERSTPPRVTC